MQYWPLFFSFFFFFVIVLHGIISDVIKNSIFLYTGDANFLLLSEWHVVLKIFPKNISLPLSVPKTLIEPQLNAKNLPTTIGYHIFAFNYLL